MQTRMTTPHMVMFTLHIGANKRTQAPARVAAHTRPRVHLRARADLSISVGQICAYVMCIPMRTHICIRMYIYIYICARASARPGATHTLTHTHLRACMHRHAQTRIGNRQPMQGVTRRWSIQHLQMYIYIRDTSTHPSRFRCMRGGRYVS